MRYEVQQVHQRLILPHNTYMGWPLKWELGNVSEKHGRRGLVFLEIPMDKNGIFSLEFQCGWHLRDNPNLF